MAVTDEDREKFLELLDEFGSDISEARKLQDNEIQDALMLPGSKTDGESGQQEYVTVTYGQVKGSGGGVQIVNNLVDGGINKALSAEMGKTLKGMIDQGGGGGQGTVKGAKVGSGSTISPDSNGIVTLPNYAENATKVESSSTNGNIKINGTETKVFEMPSSDPYTTARTPSSHSHGNIANGGTLSDTAADAAGNDLLVIRDADNNKIQTSTIKGTDVADAVSKKHSHSNKSVLDSITQEKMESWDNASSGGVTNVSYNGTTKAITKTVGGQTTEVVSASTLKADMGLTKSDIGLGDVTNDAQVKRSEMGVAGGVATLGSDGKVPSGQLPAISAAQYTQKVFLEENGGVLTQAMVNTQNTIYVIQHDYIISANITIPAGCMLEFAGGSLRNGQDGSFRITSTNTYVKNYTIDSISNLLVVNGFIPVESNTHNNGKPIYTLECFGDYRSDALAVFTLAMNNASNRVVYVNDDVTIAQNGAVLNLVSNYTTLASQNNAKITFAGTVTFNASSYLTIKDIHLHFDTPAQTDQLFVSGSNHIIIENIEMSGTVKEVDGQIQRFGGGIHVIQCLNTIIRKNRIYNVFLNGILVHNDCMYIDIVDNFVDGSTNIGIEIEGRTGGLGSTQACPCSNITIIGNQLFNCADCGININFSNTVNIVGNIVKYTRIGLNCISCQYVAISSNYVISNGSALLIDQEFFGDISLTNRNITVSDNTFSGGITNNLTGQGKVINALVPIQNAANVKLTNNTFAIHSLVDTRTKDNDCVIAILSSTGVKVLNNQITGYVDNLPAKYNTGVLIGRSYKVQQTTNYYEITDELQEIPSDIKIANNTIGYLAYGVSTIIPASTDIAPYTDGVENKVNQLQVYKNTIKNCTYDINIGYYAVDWKIDDNMLVDNDHNNYPSSGATSETPQVMKGAVKGAGYFNTSMEKQTFWSGKRWVNAGGKIIPRRIAYFGNSLLLGFGYGMAATAADKDYYYLVNKYLKGGYPDVNTTRIDARGFEAAESDTQADSGMWPLMEYIMQGAQAVIIQCGDNVDTIARQSYFTQYGAKRLLHTIRQYLPDVKIYWVGLWFDKTAVYNAIVQACEEEGAKLVDIRDLYSPENLSSIGAVRRYEESATYTKENVTNVSVDGDSITVTFHVYNADYTATIECSSYSLSGTTLTYTGYETYIDYYGESIHPSDTGFRLIANRILGALVKDFAIPFDALSSKQDKLVSGVNIKTINNQSILGSGNITIQGGGGTAQYTQKVFLEENGGVLTQAMVNTPNTIYVIQHDYDLNDPNGQNPILIPANCVLEFAGGKISNGAVVFNKTIVTGKGHIFDSVTMSGTLMNDSVYLSWFGAKGDGVNDDTSAFQQAVDFLSGKSGTDYKKLVLDGTDYKVTDTIDFKTLSYTNVTSHGEVNLDTPGARIVSHTNKPIFRVRFVGNNISGIWFAYDDSVTVDNNCICILVKSVDRDEDLPDTSQEQYWYTDNDTSITKCTFTNFGIGINYWGVQTIIRDNCFSAPPHDLGVCIKINEFTKSTRNVGGARCYRIWNNDIHAMHSSHIFIHNDSIYGQEGVIGAYGFSIQNNFCDCSPRFFVGNLIKSIVTGNYRNHGGNACVITADVIEDSVISGNYFEARAAFESEYYVSNVDGYEIYTKRLANTIISDNSFSRVMFAQIFSEYTYNTIISNNRFKSSYCYQIPKDQTLSVEYQTAHHSEDLGERYNFVTDIFLGFNRDLHNVIVTGNNFVLDYEKYFVTYDSAHDNPLVYEGNNWKVENNGIFPTDSYGIPQQVLHALASTQYEPNDFAYPKYLEHNKILENGFDFSDGTKHLQSGVYYIFDADTNVTLPQTGSSQAGLVVYRTGDIEVRQLIPQRWTSGLEGFVQKVGTSGVTRWRPICTAVWREEMEAAPISAMIGMCVFDRANKKPVWWSGDTSGGKSGWVDASGANMPNPE